MKLKYAFQRGVASALIAGVVLTAGLPALAASGAEAAETESVAVVQVASSSDEGLLRTNMVWLRRSSRRMIRR